MNKTELFLSSIGKLAESGIPKQVMRKARYALADYIGVTLAGVKANEGKLEKYLNIGLDSGRAGAIGIRQKLNLKDAVFLNGLNSHALDFDDGTNAGIIHLGSPIFSVLLPLAEKYHVGTDKFLESVVIGYETSFTMAVSIQPRHKQMGYHATGTCGVLGIALAVAHMLDFTPAETRNAFATACASATGVLSVLDDGSELKPYNVAKTALLGLVSVQMAKAGFAGNPDALGSYRGYLKMMAGDENLELEKPLLRGTYAIEKTYTKPYAACRYCHPSIEAAVLMRDEYGLRIDGIESVQIRTYDLAVKGHVHTTVPCSASAKMSIPYGVASGLVYGKAGLKEYGESCITDERVLELAAKVSVIADEECSASFPGKQTAIVRINTAAGGGYEKRVDFPKGEPENPMTDEEFKERFLDLAEYGGKTRDDAGRILGFVQDMDGSMDGLFRLL